MRGPRPTHEIELTAADAEKLQRLVHTHTTAQALLVRAQIVLAAHEHPDWNNQQIAQSVGTSDWIAGSGNPFLAGPGGHAAPGTEL